MLVHNHRGVKVIYYWYTPMRKTKTTYVVIYGLSLLLTFAAALPTYLVSSFVAQFVPAGLVGLYWAASGAITAAALLWLPPLLRRYHNYPVMLTVLGIAVLNSFALAVAADPWTALVGMVVQSLAITLLAINLDVFLENIAEVRSIGSTRTMMLTINNIAWVASPTLMGAIANGERYALVFLASGLILVATLALAVIARGQLAVDEIYRRRHLRQLLAVVWRHPNLRRITLISLGLKVFFTVAVLYIPLYLHRDLGFDWPTIGWIFTIMLLPFLILQFPAGRLADRLLGEKELLVVGHLVLMIFTGALAFTHSTNPMVWAALLFMTRVGASLIESMHEVYFFKIIKRSDADLINLFRDLQPVGWIIGSLLGVAVLSVASIPTLFLVLAIVPLLALHPTLRLQDTK